ncbi:hypothetical protein [Corynebacterium glucuronolyticum]|nr:hypothetical protein [Corynebacterium glucuronolyticum]QRP70133.1 hypothetical protein I6J21_10160 [Corynebacterium glucuronolyticum]
MRCHRSYIDDPDRFNWYFPTLPGIRPDLDRGVCPRCQSAEEQLELNTNEPVAIIQTNTVEEYKAAKELFTRLFAPLGIAPVEVEGGNDDE